VRHSERLLPLAHLLVRLREAHEDLLEQLLVVDAVAELYGVATEIRRRGRLAGLQRALRGVRQHRQAKHLRRVRGRGLGGRHVKRLVRLHVLGVRGEEIALAESIVAQLFFFLGGGQGFARGAKHVLARHDGFDVTRNLLGDRAELGDRRELPGQGRVGAIARGRHRRATENGLQAPRQHSRVVTRQFSSSGPRRRGLLQTVAQS
jgi:hypothetical protein